MAEHTELDDLHKVLEISRAMVAAADLDSLLSLIVSRSIELLRAERATIFLYDAPNNQLVSRIATGSKEIRVPADRGIAGAAVQTGKTINVPDAYADSRFNPDVDRKTGFRTRSILTIPLHDHQAGLVGVLQVLNKLDGPFGGYDETLAQTLAAQAGVAIQRATLIDHYIEKQQMERAMRLAREIQTNLLPQEPPKIAGFDIAGRCEPADETGGDTFDYMALPDGRWLVTVADATGHGIGPAIVIAETRAMLRAVSLRGSHVPDILASVNDLLCADMGGGRFVTCFCGILDAAAAALRYASAGHGPLLFYRRAADAFDQVAATGMPLGIMEGTEYTPMASFEFAPGDMAVLVTDGFFEAAAPDGELYGIERVMDMVRCSRDMPAEQIIATLRAAVAAFTHNAPPADDLTAVVIRRA